MERTEILNDCPDCQSTRTVVFGVCYVCFFEVGENAESAEGIFDFDEVIMARGSLPSRVEGK